VNRKLIRPTLAEVRNKSREAPAAPPKPTIIVQRAASRESTAPSSAPTAPPVIQVRKRQPPVADTFAELYYYKKQIDAHTLMIIVLQDGEEIKGTIEWYDRNALKINRRTEPNLLLLKHNVKYMYKAEEREEEEDDGDDD
jgi:sRNA-binding regulator protein Hfq